MPRNRPPWRTDEDARERMLDGVVREAAEMPDFAREFARSTKSDEVLDEMKHLIEPIKENVLASAEEAEGHYRELAAKARHDLEILEDLPLIGSVLSLVLIPALAFVVLLGVLVFNIAGATVSNLVSVLAWISFLGVGIGVLVLTQRGVVGAGVARAWAWTGVGVFCLALGLLLVFGAGVSWMLPVGLAMFVGPIVYGFGKITQAVFPGKARIVRRRLAWLAFENWQTTLLHDGVLPVLHARINDAANDDFSTTLTVRYAHFLSRANPLGMHVATPASHELSRLIGRLGGGSFALAGPRGAGKSNLLMAFCGGRYHDATHRPDLAVQVSAPVEYVPREFVLHLFGAACLAATRYVRLTDPAAAKQTERRDRLWPIRIAGDLRHGAPSSLADLMAVAQANLLLIRYVRSYTTEANTKGGGKGFEVGLKRAVNLEGRALTYPELVDRFRAFLKDAVAVLEKDATQHNSQPGRVLIGIDELDRLGAGEPARRFLNEVKAIFDVSGCYYLVTVSTEAHHDFELSGIGLRSVFDSSFDEVIRVDYLDFAHAKDLLRRYVIGLSEQFLALAYVLSGGLARQLVRTCRAISEHHGEPLGAVAATLAGVEMLRTCQATADALASTEDREGVSLLLQTLDERPSKITGDELRTYATRVLAAYQSTGRAGELRHSAVARIYFLATVLEVFTEDLTKDRMAAIADGFDSLAKARRYLGVNATTGIALIHNCCTEWSLPTLEHGEK